MREIISEAAFNSIINVIAVVGPVVGLLAGLVVSRTRHSGRSDVLKGLATGLLGPGVWTMWRVYEAVTAQFGLSSTNNILVQLGLFIVVGIAFGVVYTIFCVKPRQTD